MECQVQTPCQVQMMISTLEIECQWTTKLEKHQLKKEINADIEEIWRGINRTIKKERNKMVASNKIKKMVSPGKKAMRADETTQETQEKKVMKVMPLIIDLDLTKTEVSQTSISVWVPFTLREGHEGNATDHRSRFNKDRSFSDFHFCLSPFYSAYF